MPSFDFLKKKPVPQHLEIREMLFGDVPLSQWPPASSKCAIVEPWATFVRAKGLTDSGDTKGAVEAFRSILEMPELESRHYLQAWFFLRESGVNPSEENGKEVLGIVVEVGMSKGLDLVAAYSDRHARYYNYSGAGVVWDRPNDLLDAAIGDLLKTGNSAVKVIGPWREARPAAPATGHARINLLTPSGLHFGQGSLDILGRDRLGGAVIASAFRLMQELIRRNKM